MTKPGRNKRRRANQKARRRAEAQARRALVQEINAELSDSEVDQDVLDELREINVSDYTEPVKVGDGMPGFWANRTHVKGLIETTECRDCGENFCTSRSCAICACKPSVLECLCAPATCKNCFAKFAVERGWDCDDPDCDKVHTNCASCRKQFAFPSGFNGHNCDRVAPCPTTCVRVQNEPVVVADPLDAVAMHVAESLNNEFGIIRLIVKDAVFEIHSLGTRWSQADQGLVGDDWRHTLTLVTIGFTNSDWLRPLTSQERLTVKADTLIEATYELLGKIMVIVEGIYGDAHLVPISVLRPTDRQNF